MAPPSRAPGSSGQGGILPIAFKHPGDRHLLRGRRQTEGTTLGGVTSHLPLRRCKFTLDKKLAFTPGRIYNGRMSEKKKLGRPKSGYQVRDAEVSCSLTAADADWLNTLAADLGFKDRGQMLTAMLERLRAGGFAPFAFAKLGFQFYQIATKSGSNKGAGIFNPLQKWPPLPEQLPTAPIPALAAVEELPLRQQKLLQQVEKQTV